VLLLASRHERGEAVREFVRCCLQGGSVAYCSSSVQETAIAEELEGVRRLVLDTGGGHPPEELSRNLAEAGVTAAVLDFGTAPPPGLGALLSRLFGGLEGITFLTSLDLEAVDEALLEELLGLHTLLLVSAQGEKTAVTPLPPAGAAPREVGVVPGEAVDTLIKRFLDLVVLAVLSRGPMHGYSIIKTIFRSSGVLVSQGMLYPLLRRLEEEGLVAREAGRSGRGKVYVLTSQGREALERRRRELESALGYFLGLIGGGSSISP